MDEQRRGRIRDDLKGFFRGELHFDDLSRALYSTDASIFQIRPAGVAMPRDEEDLQGLVRYASEQDVPLIARGAGSGVAGESLGEGLIVDLSRHFRRIVSIESDRVTVQPGVPLGVLQRRLEPLGRRFAPDPASGVVCTIGGMLANNASGAHALRHGYTRDHVQSLRLVLDSGEVASIGPPTLPLPVDHHPAHLSDILESLALLLKQNEHLIDTCRPRTLFNRCGYLLDGVLRGDQMDITKLLVGSEGTLGIFTEATLRTISLAGGRAVVMLSFPSLESALKGAMATLVTKPAACELLDRRILGLMRGADSGRGGTLVPASAEAILLVAYEADTSREARDAAKEVVELMSKGDRLALHATTAYEPAEMDRLWQLREGALPSLYGFKGGTRPVPIVEDVAVPVECLPDFMRRVQEILREHETTASFMIHAGAGQVHTRPFLDLERAADVAKLALIAEQVHTLALELGGTVSTQHGTGLARTAWVARQYGALYPVFRQIKAIFDPKGIFNPGKIVDPDPATPNWPLRATTKESGSRTWELNWKPDEPRAESLRCNGCGHCRTELSPQRMCPIFRAGESERASPRSKANLVRELLGEESDDKLFASDRAKRIADLCVNCKMCAIECPAHVNIPKLMLEVKAANVAQHGLDRTEWFLARMEGVLRWGSAFAPLANRFLASGSMRWLMERLFGLSRERRLPPLARRSFLKQARRLGLTTLKATDKPRVVYFVDLYANYIDPDIAFATVRVLEHHGFDVYVPPGQRGSGMEALAHGDAEAARDIAKQNLRVLADCARQGLPIICSEPRAALMLRQDYLILVDDDDSRRVADCAIELTTFLGNLANAGKLRTDFRTLDIALGHHIPCHVKALGGAIAGPDLLSRIPGTRVHTVDVGCSGMADTYGLKRGAMETSLRAGREMLNELDRPRVLFGSTECGACRMQMEHGAGKRTLHPVQYLALAYGLLPQADSRLREAVR